MAVYCRWVRLFSSECALLGHEPWPLLTRDEADRFAGRHARRRGIDLAIARASARGAMRAWAWGLAASGAAVPPWTVAPKPKSLAPILAAFVEHRRDRNGVAASTLSHELSDLRGFVQFLRVRGRRVTRVLLADIDAYVLKLRERLSRRTVAGVCHSVRAYLRFLYVTGRLRHDLAASVVAPRCRAWERPPRALPWDDVKAILRSVDRSTRVGRRDYALLLTMTAYGLGAAEARTLELGDVDWSGGRIRVRRPKTGQQIVLPLLAAVARALLAYLRHGRPVHATSRTIFVQMHAPHGALAQSAAIRHIIVKHARLAGVDAAYLGSHVLRHSHASHQVDLGVPLKVVGDILGHRSPASTSVYVRVALRRLSALALPVPL